MSSPLEKIMAAREAGQTATVEMTAKGPMLGLFTLFGRGVVVDAAAGCTIHALACDRLGISEDYLTNGIQTVFLDGWAVDNIETAIVEPGAVVAFSAAMPGLVGATMRRGGHYAALRSNITHAGAGESAGPGVSGAILVKLFNQVARDLGMAFLCRGVWVEGDRFADFFHAQPAGGIVSATVDGKPMPAASLQADDWKARSVNLFVHQ